MLEIRFLASPQQQRVNSDAERKRFSQPSFFLSARGSYASPLPFNFSFSEEWKVCICNSLIISVAVLVGKQSQDTDPIGTRWYLFDFSAMLFDGAEASEWRQMYMWRQTHAVDSLSIKFTLFDIYNTYIYIYILTRERAREIC